MGMIIRDTVNYTHGGNANYVEVTQAEYDALSPAKKNNGTMYFITDAPDDTTIAPIIYSDEEREVGVWRDGKPLYQKTLHAQLSSFSASYTFNLSSLNIDTPIFIDAIGFLNTPNKFMHLMNFGDDVGYRVVIRFYDNGVEIVSSNSAYNFNEIYATIQYTKTTDTAGSGKWAPSGVPAIHYSTEEQVVGTWIDGKPVYEKVVDLGTMPSAGSESVVNLSITNLKDIIDINIQIKSNSDSQYRNLPIVSRGTIRAQCLWYIDYSTNIHILNGSDGDIGTSYSGFAIVRYTKSS